MKPPVKQSVTPTKPNGTRQSVTPETETACKTVCNSHETERDSL